MSDSAVAGLQRALLEQLVALGEQQAHALDQGDIALLAHLSELRSKAVGDAAAYLPPGTPWAPELAGMVTRVLDHCNDLQQSIRACMAVVRRDLAALADHQRATQYLSDALPRGHNHDE